MLSDNVIPVDDDSVRIAYTIFSKPICPSCNLKYWEQQLKDINSLKYTTPLY